MGNVANPPAAAKRYCHAELVITDPAKGVTHYLLRRQPLTDQVTWDLTKFEGHGKLTDKYTVSVRYGEKSCTCPSCCFQSTCKHIAALDALDLLDDQPSRALIEERDALKAELLRIKANHQARAKRSRQNRRQTIDTQIGGAA
jgi:hypothetical protein